MRQYAELADTFGKVTANLLPSNIGICIACSHVPSYLGLPFFTLFYPFVRLQTLSQYPCSPALAPLSVLACGHPKQRSPLDHVLIGHGVLTSTSHSLLFQ